MKRMKHWRPRFSRRGQKAPYRNTVWREEYEHALIMSDLRRLTGGDMGRIVKAKDLMSQTPGRYNKRYLREALGRMNRRKLIRYHSSQWNPWSGGGSIQLCAGPSDRQLAA